MQVVNVGSGVSILKVTGPGQFVRVSGTRCDCDYLTEFVILIFSLAGFVQYICWFGFHNSV